MSIKQTVTGVYAYGEGQTTYPCIVPYQGLKKR